MGTSKILITAQNKLCHYTKGLFFVLFFYYGNLLLCLKVTARPQFPKCWQSARIMDKGIYCQQMPFVHLIVGNEVVLAQDSPRTRTKYFILIKLCTLAGFLFSTCPLSSFVVLFLWKDHIYLHRLHRFQKWGRIFMFYSLFPFIILAQFCCCGQDNFLQISWLLYNRLLSSIFKNKKVLQNQCK